MLICCISSSLAVTGVVIGRKGRPLEGASVHLAGSPSLSTLTAADGSFTLDIATEARPRASAGNAAARSVNELSFYSDGRTPSSVRIFSTAGRIVAQTRAVYPQGHHTFQPASAPAPGAYVAVISAGGRTTVHKVCSRAPGARASSMQESTSGQFLGKSLAGPMQLVTSHVDYFSDTTAVDTDNPMSIALYRREQNVLVFGNSYNGGMRDYFVSAAASIGATARVVVIRSTGDELVQGFSRDHEITLSQAFAMSLSEAKGYGIGALEADYSARIRGRDALYLTNLADYQPYMSHSTAMASNLETLNQVDEWDYVTDQTGSKWGNDSSFGLSNVLAFADTVRAHLPDVRQLQVETIAYRNDYLIYGPQDGVAFTIDDRVFDANTAFQQTYEYYTETMHYIDIRRAYRHRAQRIGGDVLLWATAVQNLRFDSEYGYVPFPDPSFNYFAYTNGVVPDQSKTIHRGIRDRGDSYLFDHHPNNLGEYIQALVAVQMVFGQDVRAVTGGPSEAAADGDAIRRVVYETVAEQLQPDTTSRLIWNP